MRVHVWAHMEHYRAHLEPIWDALPDGARGVWHPPGKPIDDPDGVALVAGHRDLAHVHRAAQVVLVEHGAGQTYGDATHPAYSGGEGREQVDLFICPSETVAARNRARYPHAQVAVVGAPVLDPWHSGLRGNPEPDLAVISFHYDEQRLGQRIPELRSALSYWAPALADVRDGLARQGIRLAGHAHPRIGPNATRVYRRAGIPFIESWAEVLDRAAIYAVDNSSTGPEFASTGRPLVWLNAPWYRRTVDHGGRFWAWTDGLPVVDRPDDLADTIAATLRADLAREARERMVRQVYAHVDGSASQRAADAIVALATNERKVA